MKRYLCILLLLVFFCGCTSEVYLSPRYQQTVEMSSINIKGMLKDCQGGNQQSCEEGLKQAAKTLDLILDASYGRADNASN